MRNCRFEKEYVPVLFFIYKRNSKNKANRAITKLVKMCFLHLKGELMKYEVRACVKSVKIEGPIYSLQLFIQKDDFHFLSPRIGDHLQHILEATDKMKNISKTAECLEILNEIKDEIDKIHQQAETFNKEILNQKLYFFDQIIKNENSIYQIDNSS